MVPVSIVCVPLCFLPPEGGQIVMLFRRLCLFAFGNTHCWLHMHCNVPTLAFRCVESVLVLLVATKWDRFWFICVHTQCSWSFFVLLWCWACVLCVILLGCARACCTCVIGCGGSIFGYIAYFEEADLPLVSCGETHPCRLCKNETKKRHITCGTSTLFAAHNEIDSR